MTSCGPDRNMSRSRVDSDTFSPHVALAVRTGTRKGRSASRASVLRRRLPEGISPLGERRNEAHRAPIVIPKVRAYERLILIGVALLVAVAPKNGPTRTHDAIRPNPGNLTESGRGSGGLGNRRRL